MTLCCLKILLIFCINPKPNPNINVSAFKMKEKLNIGGKDSHRCRDDGFCLTLG